MMLKLHRIFIKSPQLSLIQKSQKETSQESKVKNWYRSLRSHLNHQTSFTREWLLWSQLLLLKNLILVRLPWIINCPNLQQKLPLQMILEIRFKCLGKKCRSIKLRSFSRSHRFLLIACQYRRILPRNIKV